MNTRKILMALTVLTLLFGTLAMSGCNTWHGAGKDVEKTGERMQHGDHD